MRLEKYFPSVKEALALDREELSKYLLNSLIDLDKNKGTLNLHNFVISSDLGIYAGNKRKEIEKAITESWIWLEHNLMLAPTPGREKHWLYVTEQGIKFATEPSESVIKRHCRGVFDRSAIEEILEINYIGHFTISWPMS